MRHLTNVIERAIGEATGRSSPIVACETKSGGSTCQAWTVTLADKRRYFAKAAADPADYPGMFAAEFHALELLQDSATIRTPIPIACSDAFIVMDSFEAGGKSASWQTRMGTQLAELHTATIGDTFGFDDDNYLGAMPQPNKRHRNWIEFWRDQRLLWQLDKVAQRRGHNDLLFRLGSELSDRLDDVLASEEQLSVLLHGDLWSGNAAADERGQPIIFDPASYYGHREAELGMMLMFGGFDECCFKAYAEVWPLTDGHQRRIAVYRLYHELNHLNLFGSGYYDSCLSTLREVL